MKDGIIEIKANIKFVDDGMELNVSSNIQDMTPREFTKAMGSIMNDIFENFANKSDLDEGYVTFLKTRFVTELI